jgi:hypothetical protein
MKEGRDYADHISVIVHDVESALKVVVDSSGERFTMDRDEKKK